MKRPAYKIGQQFKMSDDALDNYGAQYRDKTFTVRTVYDHYVPVSQMETSRTGHPGFDESAGSALYGSELNFDLYEWEMLPA